MEDIMQPIEQPIQNIEQLIESILFAAGHPVEYRKIAEVSGLTEKDVRSMVEHMAGHYTEEGNPHGILLLLFPETCQLTTKEEYAPYIRKALGIRRGGNLSNSSLEVLAVVAYNQPVTRAYIDVARGVDSSYAVNSLLDKGLIEATGRLEEPGRPMLYSTTDKFLRVFGMNSLEDLPETEALSAAVQAQAAKTGETGTGDESPADATEAE